MGPGLLLQCHSSGSWKKRGSNIHNYGHQAGLLQPYNIHFGICVGIIKWELCFDCFAEGCVCGGGTQRLHKGRTGR